MAKTKKNIPTLKPEVTITDRSVSEFLDNEYRDYALYTIENRAIPSIVDGYKRGARKILHAAFSGSVGKSKDKGAKVLNLVGDVYNLSGYHHGNSSIEDTVVTLSAEFKDNLPPLKIVGQGGSIRAKGNIAAPRYLSIKLSDYASIYQIDADLLEYEQDEGVKIEPKYYLPIIPTVLTANTSGMATAYAFSSFSYHPLDIIENVKRVLTNQPVKEIRPYVHGLTEKAQWFRHEERWHNRGFFELDLKNNAVIVTEWPYDKEFSAVSTWLNWLVDENVLKEWRNDTFKKALKYTLFFTKEHFKELQKDPENYSFKYVDQKGKNKWANPLRNTVKIDKDSLTVLNEFGKVQYFETPELLLEYFVKFRLRKYSDRKTLLVQKIKEKIQKNEYLIQFIKYYIEGTIILANVPISEVKKQLDSLQLPYFVLQLAISKITKEEYLELQKDNQNLKTELDYIIKTTETNMYLDDLKSLEKQLSDKFVNQQYL